MDLKRDIDILVNMPKAEETPVDSLVMWRADTSLWKAVMVECPRGLYPNHDADNIKIFDNTHFKTAAEAWEKLEGEASAWVTMAARNVESRKADLARANQEAAEAAIQWKNYRDNREHFAP